MAVLTASEHEHHSGRPRVAFHGSLEHWALALFCLGPQLMEEMPEMHAGDESWWHVRCRCDDSDEEGDGATSPRAGRTQRLEAAASQQADRSAGGQEKIGLVELGNLKPHAKHNLAAKSQYIQAKYNERRFVAPASSFPEGSPQQALWLAVLKSDLKGTMRARVCSADVAAGYTSASAAALVAEAQAASGSRSRGPSPTSSGISTLPPNSSGNAASAAAPEHATALHLACRVSAFRLQLAHLSARLWA
ncbi:hypothetical protein MMC29_001508 [Sticta canariensis]|nr:hypothetical protein [Sticta canariensis]